MKRLLTTSIILHHTAGRLSWSKSEAMKIILGKHGVSPYHIVIGKDWEVLARNIDEVGWHAGNWPVNLTSVAVCLNGDFTRETPTEYQKEKLRHWLLYLKNKYAIPREKIRLHKEVRLLGPTACPGFGQGLVDAIGLGVKPLLDRVNEALRACGDDPTRSVGTLNLSKWWQNSITARPEKFTNDEAGYQALVGAIKWHQARKKYPHDN